MTDQAAAPPAGRLQVVAIDDRNSARVHVYYKTPPGGASTAALANARDRLTAIVSVEGDMKSESRPAPFQISLRGSGAVRTCCTLRLTGKEELVPQVRASLPPSHLGYATVGARYDYDTEGGTVRGLVVEMQLECRDADAPPLPSVADMIRDVPGILRFEWQFGFMGYTPGICRFSLLTPTVEELHRVTWAVAARLGVYMEPDVPIDDSDLLWRLTRPFDIPPAVPPQAGPHAPIQPRRWWHRNQK